MGLAADSSYALLDRLSSSRASRRQTINILFLGFHPDAVDPILSLIRSGRMAPRGRQVQSREDLLAALSERGWDLLFCGTLEDGHDFPAATAVSLLQGREKDIPVIQLSHDTSQDAQLQAYKDGVAALLPAQPGELLLHVMLQQLQALEDRRRLRQSEAMLEVAERHFHEQVSQSRTPIAYLTDGQIIFVNDSLVELMGVSKSYELIGTELDQLILPEHRQKVADMLHAFSDQHRPIDTSLPLELTRPDNSMFKAQVQFQTCRYQGQLALSMNITPEQFSEEANAAVHRDDDPLTGLKNGSYLIQRLDDTAQHALAGGHDAQLFYIRLDQYEDLLATHGQEATNGLIRLIAERLDKAFYDPHLVCRFEDDSFAIIFRHPNTDESLKVARKLARQIAGLKLQHAQTTVSTSASVGVVSITDSAPPASELLHRARKAADELTDGNGCVLYQPPATLHPQNDSGAVKRVLTAISDRRLKLMFQPIVPLEADTETHNYEVLVRLLDENGETLAPNFFLTSIEQSDVMVKMDRWVLEHGLQQLREENDKGTKNRLFINLAGRSLHSCQVPHDYKVAF